MRNLSNRFFWWYALYLAPLALVLVIGGCATTGATDTPMPELEGTRWTVARVDGNYPLQGEPLTLEFGSDGRITGDTGCNRFSGPFIQNGASLQVGELLSTKRACTDAQRQRQEQLILAVLQGNSTARLNHNFLTLTARTGALELTTAGLASSNGFPRQAQYDCDGVGLQVSYESGGAELSWSDGRDMLTQRPAGSGVSYESSNNSLRGKQEMTWVQNGSSTRTCRELR